jgi:hypothetical protein
MDTDQGGLTISAAAKRRKNHKKKASFEPSAHFCGHGFS